MILAPLAVFRCDASLPVGGGHVMRCLTLADVLAGLGWRCAFATASGSVEVVPALAASRHEVASIDADHDSADMCAIWPAADLLVVDHYNRDAEFERGLRAWATRILAIEDLITRPHSCDILLDQTYGRTAADHAETHAGLCLCGSSFALLRPQFRAQRTQALARRDGRPVSRVFVALGTTDIRDATSAVLDAVARAAPHVSVDVLLGGTSPNLATVRERIARMPNTVTLHADASDVAQLMAGADLAIGTPGTASWERCCLGLPTILVTVADNQEVIVARLAEAGAALDAGRYGDSSVDRLTAALIHLINDADARRAMASRAAAICDGRGALRVVLGMLPTAVSRSGGVVRLRAAEPADETSLLRWQSEPEARRFSRNPNMPSLTEHRQWLHRTLDDPHRLLIVIEHAGQPVGSLRLDRVQTHPHRHEVSILIAADQRGNGIASAALDLARRLLPASELVAEVLPGNAGSVALFTRAGYRRESDTLFRRRS
ncbi:MAG: UDP-2,4-diacetamido-2,4,6-trideoxy-beta-L-altropyranose hydrolase [Gemmatimonadota bacterium]